MLTEDNGIFIYEGCIQELFSCESARVHKSLHFFVISSSDWLMAVREVAVVVLHLVSVSLARRGGGPRPRELVVALEGARSGAGREAGMTGAQLVVADRVADALTGAATGADTLDVDVSGAVCGEAGLLVEGDHPGAVILLLAPEDSRGSCNDLDSYFSGSGIRWE